MSNLPKIGIDIGNSSIKLVELLPNGRDKWKLAAASSIASPAGGILGGAGNLTIISQSIAKMMREVGVKYKRVVAALPEEQISSHVVEMPMMSDDEVRQALQWQVEQYIPIAADKAVWSYEVIKKDQGSGEMEVLLVAAAKNLVNAYIQAMEQAGLEVVALETELMAISRAVVPAELPLAMIIDMGAAGTDIGIVSYGQLLFSRTIPTGGDAFTRAIETTLGLDSATAEQYKNAYGFSEDKLKGELIKAMKPVLSIVGSEVRKTADFHASKHSGEAIKQAILTGGASTMPDLVGVLSAQIGLEVVIGNPLQKVSLDQNQARMMEGNAPVYAVALGLAMRPI